jgi:hypothetical protein
MMTTETEQTVYKAEIKGRVKGERLHRLLNAKADQRLVVRKRNGDTFVDVALPLGFVVTGATALFAPGWIVIGGVVGWLAKMKIAIE